MRIADMMISFPGLVWPLPLPVCLDQTGQCRYFHCGCKLDKYARLARSMVLKVKEESLHRGSYSKRNKDLENSSCTHFFQHGNPDGGNCGSRYRNYDAELASLSFLGFGATAPTPEWGLMLNEGRTYMAKAPWLMIYPVSLCDLCCLFSTCLVTASVTFLTQDRSKKI